MSIFFSLSTERTTHAKRTFLILFNEESAGLPPPRHRGGCSLLRTLLRALSPTRVRARHHTVRVNKPKRRLSLHSSSRKKGNVQLCSPHYLYCRCRKKKLRIIIQRKPFPPTKDKTLSGIIRTTYVRVMILMLSVEKARSTRVLYCTAGKKVKKRKKRKVAVFFPLFPTPEFPDGG